MARTKGKKQKKNAELDEESLKKIYTGKNFIPPKEQELETINEGHNEISSNDDENEGLQIKVSQN